MTPRLLVGFVLCHLDVTAAVSLLSASRLSLGADLAPIGHQVVVVKDNEGMSLSMVPTVAFHSLAFVLGLVVLQFVLPVAEVANIACKV